MLAGARRSSGGRRGRIWCRRLRRGSGRRWGGPLLFGWCLAHFPAARLLGVILLQVLVAVVVAAVEGVGHWVHIVPRARCVHNAGYRFVADDRLDVGAQDGLVAEDGDDAGDAKVAEDSGMPYSIQVVAVGAGKDRLAVDNAGRKDASMAVEAQAEAAVEFATAHAPWTNHWGAEEALQELRDWRLARMAPREEAVSSM
jgi:hypothetical protein